MYVTCLLNEIEPLHESNDQTIAALLLGRIPADEVDGEAGIPYSCPTQQRYTHHCAAADRTISNFMDNIAPSACPRFPRLSRRWNNKRRARGPIDSWSETRQMTTVNSNYIHVNYGMGRVPDAHMKRTSGFRNSWHWIDNRIEAREIREKPVEKQRMIAQV
jgi:hypothetical protein